MTRPKPKRSGIPGEIFVCFSGQQQSLQEIFGRKSQRVDLAVAKLWTFMQDRHLLKPTLGQSSRAGRSDVRRLGKQSHLKRR